MSPRTPPHRSSLSERRLRIELLRMQARYERLSIARSAHEAGTLLTPSALFAHIRQHWMSGSKESSALRYARMGLRLIRRYPMMASLLSSAFTSARRGRKTVSLAVGAWALWRAFRQRRRIR